MTLKNLALNSNPVNLIIEAICDRCRLMRSRRGGNIVIVGNCEKFICKDCLDYLEASVRRDYLRAYGGGVA